jgi:hypothetical protein
MVVGAVRMETVVHYIGVALEDNIETVALEEGYCMVHMAVVAERTAAAAAERTAAVAFNTSTRAAL